MQLHAAPGPMLSIVIPVYNEAESLEKLHEELREVAAEQGYELDVVFVDDGSTDGSWAKIAAIAARDPEVRGIRFRTNFGKAAGLSAGFAAACGDRVMTLDADLQDDPHEIPRFLEVIDSGADVVSGWKKVRHDPWHKVFPSRVFNGMASWLTGVKLHDHNCGMKCYRREVLDEIQVYGELHRFVPILAAARGFRVGEVVVNHRARRFGHSKYGVSRMLKGFLDLLTVKFLTGFRQRPQHLLGAVGMASFSLGLVVLGAMAIYWLVVKLSGGDPLLHERPLIIYALGALLLGGQLLSIGLIGELITSHFSRSQPGYSIAEQTGRSAQSSSQERDQRDDASGAA